MIKKIILVAIVSFSVFSFTVYAQEMPKDSINANIKNSNFSKYLSKVTFYTGYNIYLYKTECQGCFAAFFSANARPKFGTIINLYKGLGIEGAFGVDTRYFSYTKYNGKLYSVGVGYWSPNLLFNEKNNRLNFIFSLSKTWRVNSNYEEYTAHRGVVYELQTSTTSVKTGFNFGTRWGIGLFYRIGLFIGTRTYRNIYYNTYPIPGLDARTEDFNGVFFDFGLSYNFHLRKKK